MRMLRLYTDTSTFGGRYDQEYAKESRWFFKVAAGGRFKLVVSKQVDDEIDPSPEAVKKHYALTLSSMEYLKDSSEIEKLADLYIARKVLTEKYRSDATHIAYATIHKCDGVVSWNFTHMVKLSKIVRFNMVNAEYGYPQLFIASPREVKEHENGE